jgi:hypothetical protein
MRVMPTVNLTNHQKMLLAKIANAPESPNGGKKIHIDSDKLSSAKEFLLKLNLITFDTETELMNLTDTAIVLMQEEGILDETGQLTDIGKQYAKGETPSTTKESASPQNQQLSNETFHISFKNYLMLLER